MEWGKTKGGQPYVKNKKYNKKLTFVQTSQVPKTKEDGKYKVISVSMYSKNNQNKVEVLGTTKKFDSENEARNFGERISAINSKESNHPSNTETAIVVAKSRADALKKIQKLRSRIENHNPNAISFHITDGTMKEV